MSSVKEIPILDVAVGAGPLTIDTGAFTVPNAPTDYYKFYRLTGSVVLAAQLDINPTGTASDNIRVVIWNEATITTGGSHAVTVFGETIPDELLTSGANWKAECIYNGSAWVVMVSTDWVTSSIVNADRIEADAVTTAKILDANVTTAKLADDSVTLAKLNSGTAGNVIYFDAAGDPQEADLSTDGALLVGEATGALAPYIMSGDATMSKSGAVSIANSAIDTVKLDAALKEEIITVPVSFETGEQCDNKIKMPYPGTVNHIYAISTKAIAATDDGTIVLKNDAGTTMTDGTITFGASDTVNTAYTDDPSANNTFIADEVIYLTTSKVTAGGKALVSLHITRA